MIRIQAIGLNNIFLPRILIGAKAPMVLVLNYRDLKIAVIKPSVIGFSRIYLILSLSFLSRPEASRRERNPLKNNSICKFL